MNQILKDTLVNQLDPVTEFDRDQYVRLDSPLVEQVWKKAALIDGVNVPKSLMKCDFDGSIFVIDWFYGKEFE